MDAAEAQQRFVDSRHAVLATKRSDGGVDLVPVTFVVDGDSVFTLIDHKPKTTTALRRLRNISHDARVTLLAECYDDSDWSRLWWVRARGVASVVVDGPVRDAAAQLIAKKYAQYRHNEPTGAAISIEVAQWSGWSAR